MIGTQGVGVSVSKNETREEKKPYIMLATAIGNWLLDPVGQFKEPHERDCRIFSMQRKRETFFHWIPSPLVKKPWYSAITPKFLG